MCTKVSHRSRKKARQAAYAMKCKGKVSARTELREYYCNKCNAWHLTHMSSISYLNSFK